MTLTSNDGALLQVAARAAAEHQRHGARGRGLPAQRERLAGDSIEARSRDVEWVGAALSQRHERCGEQREHGRGETHVGFGCVLKV